MSKQPELVDVYRTRGGCAFKVLSIVSIDGTEYAYCKPLYGTGYYGTFRCHDGKAMQRETDDLIIPDEPPSPAIMELARKSVDKGFDGCLLQYRNGENCKIVWASAESIPTREVKSVSTQGAVFHHSINGDQWGGNSDFDLIPKPARDTSRDGEIHTAVYDTQGLNLFCFPNREDAIKSSGIVARAVMPTADVIEHIMQHGERVDI